MAQPEFIDIAGSNLQQLSYEGLWGVSQFEEHMIWGKVASLAALTRLEVTYCFDPRRKEPELRDTGLIDVVLIRCPDMPALLLEDGALTSLERLHIEDDCSNMHMDEGSSDTWEEGEKGGPFLALERLCIAGNAILSLPNLKQLFRSCRLFFPWNGQ